MAEGRRQDLSSTLISSPLHSGYQGRIWIDGPSLPPLLIRPEFEDRKMQVRGAAVGVPRRSHKTNDLPALHLNPVSQPVHISVQVSIVVTILSRFVELVNRVASTFAYEQFSDGSKYYGMHGCP